MQFRGNYTLTFHTRGGVTQAMLPEPPADCPITTQEALEAPDLMTISIIKRAICNRALHHGHARLVVMGDDVVSVPCSAYWRNDAMIQFMLETHLHLLDHPDLFPVSPDGTERHGR